MYQQWRKEGMFENPHFAYEHYIRTATLLDLLEELDDNFSQGGSHEERIVNLSHLNKITVNPAAFDLTKE